MRVYGRRDIEHPKSLTLRIEKRFDPLPPAQPNSPMSRPNRYFFGSRSVHNPSSSPCFLCRSSTIIGGAKPRFKFLAARYTRRPVPTVQHPELNFVKFQQQERLRSKKSSLDLAAITFLVVSKRCRSRHRGQTSEEKSAPRTKRKNQAPATGNKKAVRT